MRVAGGTSGFDLVGAAFVFGAVLVEATYTLAGRRFMERHDAVATAMVATALSLPLFLFAAAPSIGTVSWSEVEPTT